MEKFKPFIIPVALLVLIDQMVKIVISKVFMKYEFDIIAKVLRFNPELNTRLSYAGNFFELLSSPFVTILLNVFVLFLFLSGYMLYQAKRAHTSFWVKMIMICGISGCLCSLIDKVPEINVPFRRTPFCIPAGVIPFFRLLPASHIHNFS